MCNYSVMLGAHNAKTLPWTVTVDLLESFLLIYEHCSSLLFEPRALAQLGLGQSVRTLAKLGWRVR